MLLDQADHGVILRQAILRLFPRSLVRIGYKNRGGRPALAISPLFIGHQMYRLGSLARAALCSLCQLVYHLARDPLILDLGIAIGKAAPLLLLLSARHADTARTLDESRQLFRH